jgi:threonine/homoserine/homoserine lactone efflux protein
MTNATSLLLFIVPFSIASALPGPAQTALVARVAVRGMGEAVPFAIGMVTGNAAWLCLAGFGLSAIALQLHVLFVVVKWLGVAYLIHMARRLWTAPTGLRTSPVRSSRSSGFAGGVALTLGNPKALVFFTAVLPQAFDLTKLNASSLFLVLLLGLGIDSFVQTGYVLFAGLARATLQSSRRLRVVNRCSAIVLTCSGAAIATRS